MRATLGVCGAVAGLLVTTAPAGAAVVKPSAPTGVTVVGAGTSAVVAWDAASPPDPTISRYKAVATSTTDGTRRCSTVGFVHSCTLPRLRDGGVYRVVVVAYIGAHAGPGSTPVVLVQGAPGAPISVEATIDVGRSTVSFVPPASGDSAITSYTVVATDATDAARGGQTATGPSGPLVVTGLTIGDTYTFTVRATNADGTGPTSAPSAPVVPVPLPGEPTGVHAVAGTGDAVVTFTPPPDPAEAYVAVATDLTTPAGGGQSTTGDASPITVNGLTGGDRYTFTVTAYNGPVAGPQSAASAPVVPKTLISLNAEGSSFVSVAMQEWVGEFDAVNPAQLNWQVATSVIGLNDFSLDRVDFAASDLPYSAQQSTYYPDQPYQYAPDVGSGLALMFNLIGTDGQRITDLNLTPSLVGRIFLGEIARWNDPAIVAANPALATVLPSTPVVPVYRSDAGGENQLLSDYLLHEGAGDLEAAQSAFESGAVGEPSASWPVPAVTVRVDPAVYPAWAAGTPVGEYGSDNAAFYVSAQSSVGSITYVATAFAKEHGVPVANLRNAAGDDVQPTSAHVSTAVAAATTNADLSQDLAGVYADTKPTAYPLSSFSYLVIPCSPGRAAAQGRMCDGPATPSPFGSRKGAALGQFIDYLACAGQEQLSLLGYAPIPPAIIRADFAAIGRLNGAVRPPAPTSANCPNPTLTP